MKIMTYSKYGNKICYLDKTLNEKYQALPEGENPLDYHKFDSELEREVYLDLSTWISTYNFTFTTLDKPFRLTLDRQIKIPLISDLKHNIYVNHIVDFEIMLVVFSKERNHSWIPANGFYVEAKGVPTEEAVLKWKIMESRYGYFESGKYLVVGGGKKPKQAINNHYIVSTKVALQSLTRSINTFIDAYECINGVF